MAGRHVHADVVTRAAQATLGFVEEPRLAGTGLALHAKDTQAASIGDGECLPDALEFVSPTDELSRGVERAQFTLDLMKRSVVIRQRQRCEERLDRALGCTGHDDLMEACDVRRGTRTRNDLIER
jgi:hypothetical protein